MKEIFEQYGGTILAVIAALAVLGILQGYGKAHPGGVWQAAGEALGQQTNQTIQVLGAAELERFFQRTLPVITYRKEVPVYCDTRIRLEDHFKAVDSEYRNMIPDIIALVDEEGFPCNLERTGSGTYKVFERAGVYRVFIKAEDSAGRSQVSAICFPVQIP